MKEHIYFSTIYTKLRLFLILFCVITLCLLTGGALELAHSSILRDNAPVTSVDTVTLSVKGTSSEQSLPYQVKDLSPRETFTLDFQITPSPEDELYVKTVYAPLKVYADGELIYSFGEDGSYPSFMADPPTQVASIRLPDHHGASLSITMVYEAPAARDSIILSAPLLGTSTSITFHLLRSIGISLVFAGVQIFLGLLLLFITFFLIPLGTHQAAPMWLGLFALTTGIWNFSENNLTVFLTDNPSLLYLLAFMGLFFTTIPLYHFAMDILDLKENHLLQCICLVQELAFAAALLLQLTGWLPFSRSMYYFHVSLPLSICFLAGYTLYLGIKQKNTLMKQFFLPLLVLGISSVLEVLNYQVRIISQLSSVFQIGLLIFILLSEVLAGKFLKSALMLHQKNQMLRANLDMLEKQADVQKERVMLLLKNEELIKEQRHDLKHQYAVLNSFCENEDYDALKDYLHQLIANVPSEKITSYCKNTTVNAIVSRYLSQAETAGIKTSVRLDLPLTINALSDNDLCVIFGNLLENAIEACQDMTGTDAEPFLSLNAGVIGDTLYITMDNSFNGQLRIRDGEFLSHKRNETGIGLLSIRSIVKRAGGYADFKADENVFLSNIVVKVL